MFLCWMICFAASGTFWISWPLRLLTIFSIHFFFFGVLDISSRSGLQPCKMSTGYLVGIKPLDCRFRTLPDDEAIVAMGRSSVSSKSFNSSSLSRCATISLYVPFSNLAMLTDHLSLGGSLAYSKLSIMLLPFSPTAFSAPLLSSSKKSGSFFVLGSNISRYHLCCAVLRHGFDVFSTEYYQYVLQCLTVCRVYISKTF